MSKLIGIGARMAASRAKKQASQVKAAAMLEISDKAYKNYEGEKREIPLSTAIGFCEAFEVELEWLVFGPRPQANEKTAAIVSKTIEALVSEAQERKLALSPNRAAKIGGYIFRNCSHWPCCHRRFGFPLQSSQRRLALGRLLGGPLPTFRHWLHFTDLWPISDPQACRLRLDGNAPSHPTAIQGLSDPALSDRVGSLGSATT
jgi:DNA-binding XRE family transcriptional regulator